MKNIIQLAKYLSKSEKFPFYLSGGTALSYFYLKHRESADLDFWGKMPDFRGVLKIITELKEKKIFEIARSSENGNANVIVFNIDGIKVDFIEDIYNEIYRKNDIIEGIPVDSLYGIYYKKLQAISGIQTEDKAGKPVSAGHRINAKDIYDLYHLSKVEPLSEFISRVEKDDHPINEKLIIQNIRRADYMTLFSEFDLIKQLKKTDFREMKEYLIKETDIILEKGIEINDFQLGY
ncbi:MAG: nucleotidyl transferase AbiEii/AbiGii toxin family protein [Nitrospinae bacterium]|nr:nucleotidyl transferase AbiEii/AbiGii toxin family protein [Nitrospinota bacterium]